MEGKWEGKRVKGRNVNKVKYEGQIREIKGDIVWTGEQLAMCRVPCQLGAIQGTLSTPTAFQLSYLRHLPPKTEEYSLHLHPHILFPAELTSFTSHSCALFSFSS